MDEERLKERLRRHALEMVEKVSGQMPASLRRFREVERALKEETEALHAKCLQSRCDEAEDDSSKPLCPHCGGRMEQKERKEKHVICHGGDVVVERKRWWCERCGASFFPSGRGGDGGRSGHQPGGGANGGGGSGGKAVGTSGGAPRASSRYPGESRETRDESAAPCGMQASTPCGTTPENPSRSGTNVA
jgi:YgiT-type zinc finger domain-containing protein